MVADGLSRINLEKGTYETEQEDLSKVFSVIKSREDLELIMKQIAEMQNTDLKLRSIKERLENNDPSISRNIVFKITCYLHNLQ